MRVAVVYVAAAPAVAPVADCAAASTADPEMTPVANCAAAFARLLKHFAHSIQISKGFDCFQTKTRKAL